MTFIQLACDCSLTFAPVRRSASLRMCLHAVLLLEFEVLLVEGVDTINHGLDELNLGVTQPVLVGDVIGVSSLAARFTTGSTGLDGKFLAPLLEGFKTLLGPAGKVNVDGGPHASAQVGWAGVDVAELGGEQEVLAGLSLDGVTNSLDTLGQPGEDTLDVTSLLHGDDPELILLIDPDEEGLGSVVEDATALGPVTLHTGDLQVWITRHEEEMVIDQLLADLLVHASQGVVVAGQVTFQLAEGVLHQSLNVDTLLLGDSGGKAKALDGSANTDPARVNGHIRLNVASDLAGVHVRGVLEVSSEAMILADEGVENIGEVNVGVLVTSVDAAMLVVEVDGASNGLGQGEAGGLGGDATELVPLFLGHMLGNQRVLGLDVRESGHGFC